jgi:peroxiredoxin
MKLGPSTGTLVTLESSERMRRPTITQLYRAAHTAAFASVVIMVFLLVRQLKEARDQYAGLLEANMHPAEGTFLPSVIAQTTGDSLVTLGIPRDESELQVLYFFNTTCAFCMESIPVVKQIADDLDSRVGVSFYAVSLDSARTTRAYAAAHDLNFPVTYLPDDRSESYLRVGGVPLLLILGNRGEVLWSRIGVLGETFTADSLANAIGPLRVPNHQGGCMGKSLKLLLRGFGVAAFLTAMILGGAELASASGKCMPGESTWCTGHDCSSKCDTDAGLCDPDTNCCNCAAFE